MDDEKVRIVKCSKHGKELPGLAAPPFPGVAGEQIFQNVSAQAWSEWWDGMQIKVLNEYRLNMGNPKDYQILFDQMMQFLNLPQVKVV